MGGIGWLAATASEPKKASDKNAQTRTRVKIMQSETALNTPAPDYFFVSEKNPLDSNSNKLLETPSEARLSCFSTIGQLDRLLMGGGGVTTSKGKTHCLSQRQKLSWNWGKVSFVSSNV